MQNQPLLRNPCRAGHQRGAATMVVTLVLLVAMLLVALFANRGLLLEARMSANQARSTVAFEAAEAGLEWALARLNDPAGIDGDCRAAAGATSFRERFLAPSVPPLRPACVRGSTGWVCGCPTAGPTVLATPGGNTVAPGFSVELLAGTQPGVVRVVSTGCAQFDGTCEAGAATPTDASARVEASFALLPALVTAPAAALTVRGSVAAGSAAIGLHNTDAASGGPAVHAGGTIDAPFARVTMPAGASLADALAGNDAALAALDGERLFVSYFGLSKGSWRDLPMVHRLACSGDCTAALMQAIDPDITNALIWIDGDASIDGPVTLGRPDRPVLIATSGRLVMRGPVTLHGVVYANGVAWHGAGPGLLRGALISEAGYAGDAAPDVQRDGALLATLARRSGSYMRVPGSWRDF